MFLVPVLLMVISCGGLRGGGRDNTLLIGKVGKVEKVDKSLPAFVLRQEIKTTISDATEDTSSGGLSGGDISGGRVRTFSYEEYENAPGRLPGARECLINAYLIRQMDASGSVKATILTIERWSRLGQDKRVDTWKFHDGDMDGVPDKAVFAVIAETRDNTLLDMHAVELEVDEAVSKYYRRKALEIRERGLEDAVYGGASK